MSFFFIVLKPKPRHCCLGLDFLKYTLQPAYYEISLQRKFSRDEESEKMLDIIFATRLYDVGAVNDWGNIFFDVVMMTMKNNRDIASKFEKLHEKALTDMQKTVDAYAQTDDR